MVEIDEFKEWVCQEVEKGRIPHSISLTKKEINYLKLVTTMLIEKKLSESFSLVQSIKKNAEKNPENNSYIAYVKEDYWFITDSFNLLEWGYSADYEPPKTKGIHYRKARDMEVRDCRFFVEITNLVVTADTLQFRITKHHYFKNPLQTQSII